MWECTSQFWEKGFLRSWTELLVCGRQENVTKLGNTLIYKEELFRSPDVWAAGLSLDISTEGWWCTGAPERILHVWHERGLCLNQSYLLLWHSNRLACLNQYTYIPSGFELYFVNDTIIKLGVFAGVMKNKMFGVTLTMLSMWWWWEGVLLM